MLYSKNKCRYPLLPIECVYDPALHVNCSLLFLTTSKQTDKRKRTSKPPCKNLQRDINTMRTTIICSPLNNSICKWYKTKEKRWVERIQTKRKKINVNKSLKFFISTALFCTILLQFQSKVYIIHGWDTIDAHRYSHCTATEK